MSSSNPTSNVLVIDTEQYSGNFEREMCAYITGQFGDCGVGREFAEQYSSEIKHLSWWEDHICAEEDDEGYGCYRPAAIWATPGWFNNGMGGHFKDTLRNEAKAAKAAISSMISYNKSQLKTVQDRLNRGDFEAYPGWTQKACEAFVRKCEEDVKRVATPAKYPAYLSVAVFVDEFPPEEVWLEFQQRARDFAENYDTISKRLYSQEKLTVTGFRQLPPSPKRKRLSTKSR